MAEEEEAISCMKLVLTNILMILPPMPALYLTSVLRCLRSPVTVGQTAISAVNTEDVNEIFNLD